MARKKNLIDWLTALDHGFEKSSCFKCLTEEKDELEDGKPMCEVEGKCKYFGHIKTKSVPMGNPNDFLFVNNIIDFDTMSEKIISLSSWDGAELPSVSFYPFCSGSVSMDENLFQELLDIKLSHIKQNIITEKVKRAQRGT